jgi:type II secretory pathway component PulC
MTDQLKSLLTSPTLLMASALLAGAALTLLVSTAMLTRSLLFDPEITLGSPQKTKSHNSVNTALISGRHFFGEAKQAPELMVNDLPETKLELTLRGAFAANNNEHAGAIILDDRQIANHYVIGDELPGDAILKGIYPDRVVLARGGVFETLYFPQDESSKAGINTRTQQSSSAAAEFQSPDAKKRRDAIRERIKQLRGR